MLATWRISSLLVNEDGPFEIFDTIRVVFDRLKVFQCLWCTSVWIGTIVTVGYFFNPTLTTWILLPFTISAGAILVDKYSG
jgi:hypothetical protein